MDNFIIDAPLDYDEEELEEMRKNASSYSGSSDLLDRRDGFDTALSVLDATQVNINEKYLWFNHCTDMNTVFHPKFNFKKSSNQTLSIFL